MKHLKMVLITVIALVITSCGKDDKKEETIKIEDGSYVGTLVVNQNDGTFYTKENVEVVVSLGTDNAEIKMLQVSFSDKMPVSLDITIPNVTTSSIDEGLSLSGDNIIPQAMGGDFPKFKISNLNGKLTAEDINFEMICGEFPTHFSGIIKRN